MAGKYTEAQKRATYKHFKKMREQGIPRDHGTNEQARRIMYIFNAYKYIKKYLRKNKF